MFSLNLLRKLTAEAVGTFALVFVGCGAIVIDQTGGGLGHGGVCAAFGLVIMVMIYATGHVSGAHFNPAVTLAFASIRQFSWREVPAYVLAQCLAAVLGALAVRGLVPGAVGTDMGMTATALSWPMAFGIEVVLTFFLMFVITAVATDGRAQGGQAGIAIGGAVAMGALMGGPLTGASMNPARSLGPALVAGDVSGLWLYAAAPVTGAVLGAVVYQWIQHCQDGPAESGAGCC